MEKKFRRKGKSMGKGASYLSPKGQEVGRRDFIRNVAAMVAATKVSLGSADITNTQEAADIAVKPGDKPDVPVIGIQMGPHTMLDEGIEHVLDLIRETAAVNAVLIYSHSFHGDLRKPIRFLADDHGVLLKETQNRSFPSIWVKTHNQYYQDTNLSPRPVDQSLEYADRDLFAEVIGPARKRGMKVYARILESSGRAIENFSQAVTIDVYGKPTRVGCWSNPDYRNFWIGTAEDLFRSYDLDGFQWGAERMGPLMNVIVPWNRTPPTCFCEHCIARGRAGGIDAERAREGYRKLYEYVRGLLAGDPKPAEGVFTVFLRQLLRYPEILAWEYQYRLSREAVMQGMYEKIKSIRPQAQVGWHVDHQPSSWDIVYRAEMSYEQMSPYSDFIKFIAYHDVLGPRIRWWYLERLRQTVLSEISLKQSLELYYDLFGYDKNVEPKLDELDEKGFSPDYVYRETKRSVASAAGKTKIYPGIGFDVPWGSNHIVADPQEIYETVVKAFEAGAGGIVVSREYEEMRVPNLKAVGRAVRELFKTST
jgi:hypothetical protein